MHQEYSSSVSPFQAKTGTPVWAILDKKPYEFFEIHQALQKSLRSCSMILGRENILEKKSSASATAENWYVSKHYTGRPGHFRTKNDESFNQDCSLNRPFRKSDQTKENQ